MNLCTFTGRLTRDPEVRALSNGSVVAEFGLAVNEGKNKVIFIDCEIWENQVENFVKYFFKGKPVSVVCRLKVDKWADQEGVNRTKYKFVVDRYFFVPGNASGANGDTDSSSDSDSDNDVVKEEVKKSPPKTSKAAAKTSSKKDDAYVVTEEIDDDIPF